MRDYLPRFVDSPGRNGWQQTRQYTYESPPDADRTVVLTVAFASGHWTVAILDLANAIMNLRTDDLSTIFDHLKPKCPSSTKRSRHSRCIARAS